MGLIKYAQSTEGTHELSCSEASRRATDELIAILANIYEDTPRQIPIYVLLDTRQSGMLPLQYLGAQMRKLFKRNAGHAALHMAMVINDVVMLDVTDALMGTIMRRDSVQYFSDEQKALLWLQIQRNRKIA